MLNRSQGWMHIGICFLWSSVTYATISSSQVPNVTTKSLTQTGMATVIETHVSPYSANIIDPSQPGGIPLACPTGDGFLDKMFDTSTGTGAPNALWYRCIHSYSLSDQNSPAFQAELNGWVNPCPRVSTSLLNYYQINGVVGSETCTFTNQAGGLPLVTFLIKSNGLSSTSQNPNPVYASEPFGPTTWNSYISFKITDLNGNELAQAANQGPWNGAIAQAAATVKLINNPAAGGNIPLLSGTYLMTMTADGLSAYTNGIGCAGPIPINGSMAGHTYECSCTVDYFMPNATYAELALNNIGNPVVSNYNMAPPLQCANAWLNDPYILKQKASGNFIWIPSNLIMSWPTGPVTLTCPPGPTNSACNAYVNCMNSLYLPSNPIKCTEVY